MYIVIDYTSLIYIVFTYSIQQLLVLPVRIQVTLTAAIWFNVRVYLYGYANCDVSCTVTCKVVCLCGAGGVPHASLALDCIHHPYSTVYILVTDTGHTASVQLLTASRGASSHVTASAVSDRIHQSTRHCAATPRHFAQRALHRSTVVGDNAEPFLISLIIDAAVGDCLYDGWGGRAIGRRAILCLLCGGTHIWGP